MQQQRKSPLRMTSVVKYSAIQQFCPEKSTITNSIFSLTIHIPRSGQIIPHTPQILKLPGYLSLATSRFHLQSSPFTTSSSYSIASKYPKPSYERTHLLAHLRFFKKLGSFWTRKKHLVLSSVFTSFEHYLHLSPPRRDLHWSFTNMTSSTYQSHLWDVQHYTVVPATLEGPVW